MKNVTWGAAGAVEAAAAADARWDLVQRVAASDTFTNCGRLSGFLLYVCEAALAGHEDRISEQHIGVQVFGRAPGYNSSEDSIVRSQARLLRAKLDLYFQTEGKDEPVRIAIPKGSYVPRFSTETAPSIRPPVPAVRRFTQRRMVLTAGALLAVLLLAAGTYAAWSGRAAAGSRLTHQFWTQVFDPARPAIIVPCDTALVTYETETHSDVGLAAYLNRTYLKSEPGAPPMVGQHRYTAMPDLLFTALLSRLPESRAERTFIRYARDLQMADLRGANFVLIGARRSNPWVELFDKNNNFQTLHSEELGDYIVNRAPAGDELPTYARSHDPGMDAAFAVVSFVPGITGDENVLMAAGTITPGTEGAANYLFSKSFDGFLPKAADARTGRIRHFEILLRVRNITGMAQQPEMLAYRIHQE